MGAEVTSAGVHFRVFAPKRKHVEVVIENGSAKARTLALTALAPARSIVSAWTAARSSFRTPHRGSSPTGRMDLRRSSIRRRSRGPMRRGPA
jgi:hypothetical protein